MKEHTAKLTDLLTVLVFTVFALCVLLVLLTGAGVYRNLVKKGEDSYANRTAAQYVITRVHQAQEVSVASFGGTDALVLREQTEDGIYLTRVYCQGGYLRELYSPEDAALAPGDGEAILPMRSLELSMDSGLLTVTLEDDTVLKLCLQPGKELPR